MSVAVLAQIHRQVASPHKSVASDKFDGAFNIMDCVRIRVSGVFTLIRRKACKVEYNIVKRESLHSFKPDIFLNKTSWGKQMAHNKLRVRVSLNCTGEGFRLPALGRVASNIETTTQAKPNQVTTLILDKTESVLNWNQSPKTASGTYLEFYNLNSEVFKQMLSYRINISAEWVISGCCSKTVRIFLCSLISVEILRS